MRCQHCNTYVEQNQRCCSNCGAVVNPDVPANEQNLEVLYEDEYDDEPDYEPQSEVKKPSKLLGFIAIMLAFVLIFSIIVGAYFFGDKSLFGQPDTAVSDEAYREFVQNKIVGENGMFHSESANENAEGVLSVNIAQLDKEEGNELIVAYSETSGNRINTRIACYGYNEDLLLDGKTKSAVELLGIATPIDETDYIKNNKQHMPNEKVLYTFTHKGNTYIALEYIAYNDTVCKYECHIFELEGDSLNEHSNMFVNTNGSKDYDAACSKVKNYFERYGMVCNRFVTVGDEKTDKRYKINCGDDLQFLFRYSFYRQNIGASYKDYFDFDDYSTPELIY